MLSASLIDICLIKHVRIERLKDGSQSIAFRPNARVGTLVKAYVRGDTLGDMLGFIEPKAPDAIQRPRKEIIAAPKKSRAKSGAKTATALAKKPVVKPAAKKPAAKKPAVRKPRANKVPHTTA